MEQKAEYMLLFRGTDWSRGMSPEQIQEVTAAWGAWFQKLNAAGIALSGNPLEATGKLVSAANGKTVVTDGPFAESKEALGGYFYLELDSYDAAVEIAKECPGLPYGAVVEVRQVAETCPLAKAACVTERQHELAGATA